MKKTNHYHILIGAYDHKLGPICACPKRSCDWLNSKYNSNAMNLIQDGLNTKSKIFIIRNIDYFIQTYKFQIEDARLRGGKLKCCLFILVPPEKANLPEKIMEDIIAGYIPLVHKSDLNLSTDECGKYIENWEDKFNNELVGNIGSGIMLHKMRDIVTSIIGYAQIMHDGVLGDVNEEQKESLAYILKYTMELLNIIEKYSIEEK